MVTFPDRTFASNSISLLPIKLTQSKSELWSTSSSSILEKFTGFTAVTAVVILYWEMPKTAAIFSISLIKSVWKELSYHTLHDVPYSVSIFSTLTPSKFPSSPSSFFARISSARLCLFASFASIRKPAPTACFVLFWVAMLVFRLAMPDRKNKLIINTTRNSNMLLIGLRMTERHAI